MKFNVREGITSVSKKVLGSDASTLRDFDKLSWTIMDRLIANMIVNDSEWYLKLSSTIINYHDRLNGPEVRNHSYEMTLICMRWNCTQNSFSHLDLFSNRGTRELGNGLFACPHASDGIRIHSSTQGSSAIKYVQSMRHKACDSGGKYALLLLLCRHIRSLFGKRLDTNLLRHRIRKCLDSPVYTWFAEDLYIFHSGERI